LPLTGLYKPLVQVLCRERRLDTIVAELRGQLSAFRGLESVESGIERCLHALEGLVHEGWVKGDRERKRPTLQFSTADESASIHRNHDPEPSNS
jgi:hypothetical protein